MIQMEETRLKQVIREAVEEAMVVARPQGEYLSRKELCDRLNISPPTLAKWTKDGTINGKIILGGRVRYEWSKVHKSLEQGSAQL